MNVHPVAIGAPQRARGPHVERGRDDFGTSMRQPPRMDGDEESLMPASAADGSDARPDVQREPAADDARRPPGNPGGSSKDSDRLLS